jgi:hypothetical protein
VSQLVDDIYLDEWQIQLTFSLSNISSTGEIMPETALKTVLMVKQVNTVFFVSSRFGPERGQGETIIEAVANFLSKRYAKRDEE